MLSGKPVIEHIVIIGDSLSDRATLYKRKLLGLVSMAWLANLSATSPKGRFTNGFTYADDLAGLLADIFMLKAMQQGQISRIKPLDSSDLADEVITGGAMRKLQNEEAYSLNDDKLVSYDYSRLLRSYAEGGLTAHDYSSEVSWLDFSRFFKSKTVSTLRAKRQELLESDKKENMTDEEKLKTLVIELSGANDFITVNAEPTTEIVDKAIQARIENVRELYNKGYRHFVLINLPDISLTPKYQAMSQTDRDKMHAHVIDFNHKLKVACDQLNKDLINVNIGLFDVYSIITQIYHDPEKYGFNASKLKEAFIESSDFNIKTINKTGEKVSHASGQLFWDEIHPSNQAQAEIAYLLLDQCSRVYDFQSPAGTSILSSKEMFETFIKKYELKLKEDKSGVFGGWRQSKLNEKFEEKGICVDENADFIPALKVIFDHALNSDGLRTREVLISLGWLHDGNNVNVTIPVLEKIAEETQIDDEFVKLESPGQK